MVAFIPDKVERQELKVPYFEDITAKDIPGCRTEKSIEKIQGEIQKLLVKLDALKVQFLPGKFPGEKIRYGFQIGFVLSNGTHGRIDCAALPMRSETALKKDRAIAQALFLVRNLLEAEVYSHVYRPGSVPLIPYLIGGSEQRTVTEALIETGMLPALVDKLT